VVEESTPGIVAKNTFRCALSVNRQEHAAHKHVIVGNKLAPELRCVFRRLRRVDAEGFWAASVFFRRTYQTVCAPPFNCTRRDDNVSSSDLKIIVECVMEDGFEQAMTFGLGGGELCF
jgi:hypothetical protein